MSSSDIKVGVLVPPGNTVHEAEFARLRPAGVSFRFLPFDDFPPTGAPFCDDLVARLTGPMKTLAAWGARAILIGCTTATMKCADAAVQARLEAVAGVPVIGAAKAVQAALRALGRKTVSVATPYGTAGNGTVSTFLTGAGLQVAGIAGLALDRAPEVWKAEAATLKPEALLDLALSVERPETEVLFLPCTGVPSLDTIALYESRIGKPAISSVQAGYWATLRHLQVQGRRPDAGRLLADWPN